MSTATEATSAELRASIAELTARSQSIEKHSAELREDAQAVRIASGAAVASGADSGRAELRKRAADIAADIEANDAATEQLGAQIGALETELAATEAREAEQLHAEAVAALDSAVAAYQAALLESLARLAPLASAMRAAAKAEGAFHVGGASELKRSLSTRQMLDFAALIDARQKNGVLPTP